MNDNEYTPFDYEPVPSVAAMSAAPRFEHGAQFSKFFSFSNEEQTDYTMGLVFLAAFLMTFFFLWTAAIFVFMCLGQKESGFLSGHPFVEPQPKVDEYDERKFRRPRRVRFTFLICNILVILFSVLFVTHGVKNIQATTITFSESNQQVMGLASTSYELAGNLQTVGTESAPVRDFLVGKLGSGFCPGDPNLKDHTGVDFDAIAAEAVQNLELLKDFVDNEVAEFRDYVRSVEEAAKDVDTAIQSYDVSEWKVMLYILPMIILPSFLLIGLFMAWFEVSFKEYQCMLRYLIIPLFGIVIVFSWVFCSLFSLLAVSNADFCSGNSVKASPEGTFMDMLNEQGITSDGIIYKSIEYYIDGCRTGFPFAFIDTYRNDLVDAFNSTTDFSSSLDAVGVNDLNQLCGTDFSEVASNLKVIETNLQALLSAASRGMQLISCESINSLYVNTFHEGTCTYSVTGFTWVFASLLVVSFCGMLMITFRSAVYDVIWLEDQDDPATVQGDGGMHADHRAGKEQFYDDHEENIERTNTGGTYDDGRMEGTPPTNDRDSYPNDFAQDHGDNSYAPGQSGRDW